MAAPEIRFCRLCGAPSEQTVPPMDNRTRAVCTSCGYVDYVNPINVVGTIPVWEDESEGPRILLCRRAIEPRLGFWTVPAGFLETGESIAQGALRETEEESGAHVELSEVFSVLDVLRAGQVHILLRARMLDLHVDPGPETLETTLVRIDEIPWDELAFRTVRTALQDWVTDHHRGQFGLHTGVIE